MISNRDNVVPLRAPPALAPFTPFYASQLEGYVPKPREWVIDGVLLRKTVCLFAGPPKIGKSLLLQTMLTCIACGIPWLGRETVRSRAFGLFTEDPEEELRRRQLDINRYFDRAPADFELDLSWDAREDRDALLVEFEKFSDRPKFTPFWYQLWEFVRDEGIEVIGLDTAAVIFGGNENNRAQVTAFLRELVRQAIAVNGAVFLTAHPSKSGGANSYSGSTAWLGSSRFAMSLGRPLDYDPEVGPHHTRVLRGLGANYSVGHLSERIEYRDGVFVSSEIDYTKTKRGPLTHSERIDLRYRMLMGLKNQLQNGAKVPADEMSPTSMPNRARRSIDPLINRVPLNDLYQAQADLIDSGQVVRVDVGRKIMLRPADGPYYDDEVPYVPAPAPGGSDVAG